MNRDDVRGLYPEELCLYTDEDDVLCTCKRRLSGSGECPYEEEEDE